MGYLLKWVGWEDSLSLASGAQASMQAVYEASIKQAAGMLKQESRQRLQAARLEIQATPLPCPPPPPVMCMCQPDEGWECTEGVFPSDHLAPHPINALRVHFFSTDKQINRRKQCWFMLCVAYFCPTLESWRW